MVKTKNVKFGILYHILCLVWPLKHCYTEKQASCFSVLCFPPLFSTKLTFFGIVAGTVADPFCRKFECDLELHYGDHIEDGCVPVYYGTKGCCPIDWRCRKSYKIKGMRNDFIKHTYISCSV